MVKLKPKICLYFLWKKSASIYGKIEADICPYLLQKKLEHVSIVVINICKRPLRSPWRLAPELASLEINWFPNKWSFERNF